MWGILVFSDTDAAKADINAVTPYCWLPCGYGL